MARTARVALLVLLFSAVTPAVACGDAERAEPTPTARQPESTPPASALDLPFPATISTLASLPAGYRLEALLDGLDQPTSIAATPDGRLLITEQTAGRIRVVQDGVLLAEPWFELPVYFATEDFIYFQELGLVSIAVDPLFEQNGLVYIYYTERKADSARQTVFARLRDVDGRGQELTQLVTIEHAPIKAHIAGGIAFDGDAILLGVGDHELPNLAPQLDSPVGKVLRIDRDGAPLPDNPFVNLDEADPRVYAFGVRNPFGLAVDSSTGRSYFTDNREGVGDAVYELISGADYGWPEEAVALREPLVIYDKPKGVAGITVYDRETLPAFSGDVFFCSVHDGALHWSDVGELEGFDLAKRDRILGAGCSTGVTVGADGFLYFLDYDGRLYRISN